ncbi:MAG: cbb3-type cytochrome oxidase assembly protein CcoS [Brucellaceae bacterium]|nr:cbb3-type cytochrome oxidase assembly protein CcoS [Brucellaceae bacterium]
MARSRERNPLPDPRRARARALGLVAFLWSIRSGQYDDLQGRRRAHPARRRPGRGPPAGLGGSVRALMGTVG